MTDVDPASLDFRAGYKSGLTHGFDLGYDAAEEHMADAWRAVAERVRGIGPSHAALVELRDADTRARALPVPTPAECKASWGDT